MDEKGICMQITYVYMKTNKGHFVPHLDQLSLLTSTFSNQVHLSYIYLLFESASLYRPIDQYERESAYFQHAQSFSLTIGKNIRYICLNNSGFSGEKRGLL